MNQPFRTEKSSQKIPVTWGLVLVSLLIVYVLLQPWVNRTFGWNLPALASQSDTISSSKESVPSVTVNPSTIAQGEDSDSRETSTSPERERSEDVQPQGKDTRTGAKDREPPTENRETTTRSGESTPPTAKRFDYLEEIGPNRFRSPAGLTYGPGSEEGHRLKHIERHLSDQPDRMGKHGVFEGDMANVLRWIDEAYQRSQKKAKGTSLRDENGRTVIEATFDKPIGFIGGRDGKRAKNPQAKRLRLVLDGKAVITAFPF